MDSPSLPHRNISNPLGDFVLVATSALLGLLAIILFIGWLRDRGAPSFLLAPEIIIALLGSSLLSALALVMLRNLPRPWRLSLAPALAFGLFAFWVVAGSWLTT